MFLSLFKLNMLVQMFREGDFLQLRNSNDQEQEASHYEDQTSHF